MAVKRPRLGKRAAACRREFLHHFADGFRDETYLAWERDYKVAAHDAWQAELGKDELELLIDNGDHEVVAQRAVRIEARTNLLFSFEKMALRDAVKSPVGARVFATGLFDFLHGPDDLPDRFERWLDALSRLPRKQTRVVTWPVATVFGMIADPAHHIFYKPLTTQIAAESYGYELIYESRPSWPIYADLLAFAKHIKRDIRDLRPRDMIDLQSFIWVLGSYES